MAEIYKHWLAKAGGNCAHAWGDRPLGDAKGVLLHILLVDLERQTRQIKFRLVGTAALAVLHFDRCGRCVVAFRLLRLLTVEP